MSKILYAVIALRNDEVDGVVTELRAKGMREIAAWLEARKDSLYGVRSDDWKPFNTQTVGQMLNAGGRDFQSQTNLIGAINTSFSNLDIVLEAGISIYFIDVFALFLERYKDLANRLDARLADSEKCCFILPVGLTDDCERLISACSEPWPTVFNYYSRGIQHRIALRAADLTHLRNYWLRRVSGGPNPALSSKLAALLGGDNPTTVPRNLQN